MLQLVSCGNSADAEAIAEAEAIAIAGVTEVIAGVVEATAGDAEAVAGDAEAMVEDGEATAEDAEAEEDFTATAANIDSGATTGATTGTGTGSNTAAVISGVDSGSVTEDVDPDADNLLEVGGKLNITDSDAGEAAFIAKTSNGIYGSLTINTAGNWNYAANNNQSSIQSLAAGGRLTDSITVSSVDGTTRSISIDITGANDTAIISGVSNGSVTEDVDPDADSLLETAGKLTVADPDSGEAFFIEATSVGTYGNLTIDTVGDWNYAANNNQPTIQSLAAGTSLIDSLTVSSIDGAKRTVVITIMGADEAGAPTDVSLSWVAPSEREDGTPIALSEIAGYRLYYSRESGNYIDAVDIDDGSATSVSSGNLPIPIGAYFVVLTTVDTDRRESQYSSEVRIVIHKFKLLP